MGKSSTSFKAGDPKLPNAGRQKGTPNKATLLVREVILKVAEGLGGVDGLIKWAKSDPENLKLFWSQMYMKLLPLQITGKDGGPLEIVYTREDALKVLEDKGIPIDAVFHDQVPILDLVANKDPEEDARNDPAPDEAA